MPGYSHDVVVWVMNTPVGEVGIDNALLGSMRGDVQEAMVDVIKVAITDDRVQDVLEDLLSEQFGIRVVDDMSSAQAVIWQDSLMAVALTTVAQEYVIAALTGRRLNG
jgi:23S rRNA U2552 (ribose-2'-O)-methylase RlmE/FtsJ